MKTFKQFLIEIGYDSKNFGLAAKIASLKFTKPEYDEDKEGNRIRKWRDSNLEYVTDDDVRHWLLNKRVIEDLKSGLEHLRQSYIDSMVRDRYLVKDPKAPYYWITAKAAHRWKLPPVMGMPFPNENKIGK